MATCLVYKQIVLPLVEYESFMLLMHIKHDIEQLQKLQNRSLWKCVDINNPIDIRITDLHDQAKISTLSV